MNFTLLIEKKLEEKNISKQALYKKIGEQFYVERDIKQISYPSFLARIAENKISAIDFFEIAEILDINAHEVQRSVHMKMIKDSKRISAHAQGIIKKESAFYDDSKEYHFVYPESTSKYYYYKVYFVCIDRERKKVTLELFDFLKLSITLVCEIDFLSEWFDIKDFEKLLTMSDIEKVKHLEELDSLSELLYPGNIKYKSVRKLTIPNIDWEFDYSYTDLSDIESTINFIYKKDNMLVELLDRFEQKFKEDLNSYVENIERTIDIDGVGIVFKVVNSTHSIREGRIKVVNNIEIIQLVK